MKEIPLTAWQMGRVLFQPLILIMSHIHIRGGWKHGLFHGYGSRILENEDLMDYTGNYIEGEYAPNAQEFFTSLGTSGSFPYTVTELADSFLSEHDQLFRTQYRRLQFLS